MLLLELLLETLSLSLHAHRAAIDMGRCRVTRANAIGAQRVK
ncbi:MAG: hypothetical protein ACKOEC_18235 [Acidimicrobiia bacterium]